ncbi:MAG: hydroxymethylpyrimidine/phosphomethylpyrimidine kinase [Myxococcota bacterium]|nr:hydroxymethylpyrimidine/phosphomethylpyrimidine kinase [Myxococcota bacterium]
MANVLTIAGTDPSGAAGIQVDLQVFRDLGHHGLSAITAVLWQNTVGVQGWRVLSADDLAAQIDVLSRDISPAAIKIGVLPSIEQVEVVTRYIAHAGVPVVLDPVLASGDGSTSLVEPGAMDAMRERLMEHVTILTPNLPELVQLCGEEVSEQELLAGAAWRGRAKLGVANLLLKAGHLPTHQRPDQIADAFASASDTSGRLCESLPMLSVRNVRGTGCQLSSAIAAGLADGLEPYAACERARVYLWDLLRRRARFIGKGRAVITRSGA